MNSSRSSFDEHGDSTGAELLAAAEEGRGADAIRILQADPDLIRVADTVGDTVLHIAAKAGNVDTVKQLKSFLQEQGLTWIMVDDKNADGDTALHLAIKNGHNEAAMELLKAEPRMAWLFNKEGMSAEDLAKKKGYRELVEQMMSPMTMSQMIPHQHERNRLLDEDKNDNISSALNTEDREDSASRYEKLLDNIRRIYQSYSFEFADHEPKRTFKAVPYCATTDIELALAQNELLSSVEAEFLQILAADPTLIQRRGRAGTTALHAAAMMGRMDLMRKLVGTTTELTRSLLEGDKDGNTPLHLALYCQGMHKGTKEEMLKYLVGMGPQAAYVVNKNGVSPLYLAVLKRYEDVVRYVFKVMPGNTVSDSLRERLVNAKKASIAHAAVKAWNLGMLNVVMENLPCLIDSSDEKGWKPLSYAAYRGYLNEVSYFLSRFPNSVKKFDVDGSLPMHKAVGGGHVSVVKEFISRCPEALYDVDKKGRSILHIAVMYAKSDILSYLTNEIDINKFVNLRDKEGKTFIDLANELKIS